MTPPWAATGAIVSGVTRTTADILLEALVCPDGAPRRHPQTARFTVANIKSQIKRNRQSEKARVRNKAVRSQLKTRIKAAESAADG